MRSRARLRSVRHRLNLFLTRGNHFILMGGRLYLSHTGLFSRWLPEPNYTISVPKSSLFSRIGLSSRYSNNTKDETALLISGFGRFGNMVIQMWNSAIIAKKLGLKRVLYWHNSRIQSEEIELLPGVLLKRASLDNKNKKTPPAHLVRTRAFSSATAPEGLTPRELAFLRKSLAAAILSDTGESGCFGDEVLVIHLRSGDVFWNNPHPGYGQPPMAFYELVLRSTKWEQVILVTEDGANPCFALIHDLCALLNLPLRVTGGSLDEAISTIAAASTIVMSRGTFVGSILWLMPAQRHIFSFGPDNLQPFHLELTTVTQVIDSEGHYQRCVLSGNWNNSPEQRAMMVSYPTSSLAIIGAANTD